MSRASKLLTVVTVAGLAAALALATPWQDTSSGTVDDALVPSASDPARLAAAAPVTEGIIHWKSGASLMPWLEAAEAAEALAALAAAGPRHVVVQFATAVTPQQRRALEAAGLTLLKYVGDNAFFAAVDAARLDSSALAAAADLSSARPIERDWKLHPDLIANEVFEWMVVAGPEPAEGGPEAQPAVTAGDNPIVGVYVLFHPDVDLDAEAIPLVQAHGAVIRSDLRSINGLVIELPYANIFALVAEDAVQWLEPPLPNLVELNDDNRLRTGADIVQAPPYGLDGSGVTVLVYDGGYASASHPDFDGRLHVRDYSGLSDHATHVSGTVGGSGVSSGGTYRGMAPAVTIESYGFEQEGGLQQGFLYTDPGDIEDDYSEAISVYGAVIANNSIGTNTAYNGFPCEWEGNYGATGVLIDTIARGDGSNPLFTQPFRIVWANGNERGSGRCGTTYHTTAPPACAKNHITVGAMNSNDDSVTYFTSWGYTDDGRLKPDLSAPGCQSTDDNGVTSCSSYGGYTVKCGTSMASPTVCGLGALLIQDFRQQYPGEPDFRNSTLKVLLAHTAEDLEEPGPDFKTGYGSVRVQPAVDLLRAGNFLEGVVNHGGVFSALVLADPGDSEIKVTLAWDDVPGTPNVNPVLVNDLDLHVYDPSSTRHYPWTLLMSSPSTPALRTQPNRVDNLEQVVIDSVVPGVYRIEVRGYVVPDGPQPFSIAATPLLVACSSQGVVRLDREKYNCAISATIQVVDCDLNTDDNLIETVDVTIASDSEPAGETVTLTETSAETATFRGSIELSDIDNVGVLQVSNGDTVTAIYIDEDDGQGGTNVTVTVTATIDCIGPAIANVQVADIGPYQATVTFETDEPTNCVVRYGLGCDALTESAGEGGFDTAHTIELTGLADGSWYFLAVDAEDQAGNLTTDDNDGLCYRFITPDIPDFFTESFTSGGNDLDYLMLRFTPNGSVDYYAGCAEEIDELPIDPASGTPLSISQNSYATVTLGGGAQVQLCGVGYDRFYVGDNGYITFTGGDTDSTESLGDHFDTPRVSALFDNLTASGGSVSWKQLADRAVVTYENVPEYGQSNSNTFQIELCFDGVIGISYLSVAADDGLAGLSAGEGLSGDFSASDLSAMSPCGPRPPVAQYAEASTPANVPLEIALLATDDGLPDPPAALTYSIASLPEHGILRDPGAGLIGSVPYTLVNGDNAVVYTAHLWHTGSDHFAFKANDGGTPPEGGDSNLAIIFLEVAPSIPELLYSFPLEDDPGWTTEGQWAFGQPTGGGTHNSDPTAGHTGANVYGYNLAGDYADEMPAHYLTTPALDCHDLTEVELRFWRWLGVESSDFDHATVDVSSNGVSWATVWANSSTPIGDLSWNQVTLDISAVAAEEPTVYLRWTMGPTDDSITYPGWNIDDLEVWGLVKVPQIPGDLDYDCDVDLADLAILLANYGTTSGAEYGDGDISGDGAVSLTDLAVLLAHYGEVCP